MRAWSAAYVMTTYNDL